MSSDAINLGPHDCICEAVAAMDAEARRIVVTASAEELPDGSAIVAARFRTGALPAPDDERSLGVALPEIAAAGVALGRVVCPIHGAPS